jgi:hypothetical protein
MLIYAEERSVAGNGTKLGENFGRNMGLSTCKKFKSSILKFWKKRKLKIYKMSEV